MEEEEWELYCACRDGKVEEVIKLLQNEQININWHHQNSWTSLYLACFVGVIEVVKVLLNDKRIEANKATNDGETPFYIACQNGYIEIVKLLLNDKRISIRKETDEGKTAIDIAKERNHSNIVGLIQEFDTEQRYLEYLETFQSTPFFCIENETINKQGLLLLNDYLKKNQNIRELKLTICNLTPSNILEILKTLIWKYENLQLSNLQNIEIDDIKLESTEGLEIIPIEIRNQGTKSIVQYILDLCKSQKSKPLYRTKLMVVGYENVGKTTILNCLFPIQDLGETKGMFQNTKYAIELQGKYLRKYKSKELDNIDKEIILENRQWNVQEIKETGLELILLNDKSQKKIEIYFKDQEIRGKWIERLKRVILNVDRYGIEIQDQILQNQKKSNTGGDFDKSLSSSNDQQNLAPNIDVSIWDFAKQHDHYNHYFLLTRTVFLVLWKMKDEKKGLEGLNFWFKSLSSHLQHDPALTNRKPYFSIIIVGTFLDDQNVNKSKESKELREQEILKIAKSNGIDDPIQIYEVSCSTLENINELKQDIYSTALTHGYMGEKLPLGYLNIKNSIEKLSNQEKFKYLPIIEIQELIEDCKTNSTFEFDDQFVKRGLNLLHQWGTCIYFDEPKELSNYVVLKPEFLTKEVIGKLFYPTLKNKYQNGILKHSDLNIFWPDYMDKAEMLMTLMEKFEICFKLKEDEGRPFGDQRSLFVSYLPEDKPNDLSTYWSNEISINNQEIEIERIFSFNQVPSEMISRLLVRFHDKMVDNIIWRRGVLLKHFDNKNVLCLLEVKMEESLFEIRIRGKERNECLEMMKYIYEEVKIVSGNYGGVKWKTGLLDPFNHHESIGDTK